MAIEAGEFVSQALSRGFDWYAGVPCSFLTPFINTVIGHPQLDYVSAANEGDAVALAAGAWIGGRRGVAMMQNSGLGNAVSPLTSLTHVFRIPVLVICTHRGAPGVSDEPQHALMGPITPALLELMAVPWLPFPQAAEDIAAVLDACDRHLAGDGRPHALVMAKGAVAPHALERPGAPPRREPRGVAQDLRRGGPRPTRRQALEVLRRHADQRGAVLIATTGYTGRELYALGDRPDQLYMVGSMGCAPALGLGLAMARPDLEVVVIDGDGAALMRMGNLATVGAYGGPNLTHVILDNEVHDSTGAQATVSANVDFADVAVACGYADALAGDSLDVLDTLAAPSSGPRLVHLKTRPGTLDALPRPDITPPEVVERLRSHIGSAP